MIIDNLEKILSNYQVRDDSLKLDGWHLNLIEGKNLGLGFKDNNLGGPYNSPFVKDIMKGNLYLKWADNTITSCVLNPHTINHFNDSFDEWKKTSFKDQNAPDILFPQDIPTDLKIYDSEIDDVLKGDVVGLFDRMNAVTQKFNPKDYFETFNGEFIVEKLINNIRNSNGFNISWEETDMLCSVNLNNTISSYFHRRKMMQDKNINKIEKYFDEFMNNTYEEKTSINSGNMNIVLMPSIFKSFINQFLLSDNLKGVSVAHNRALYSKEDFISHKNVFDSGINILIDGLKDYHPSTQPCTLNGVPSSREYLIKDGHLITPKVGLRSAKMLDMKPTSGGNVIVEIDDLVDYSEMISSIDKGVIVYGVLGMNTQDPKSGNYSLNVHKGLYVENGKIKGKVKGPVISGNFLDSLKDSATEFSKYNKTDLVMKTYANVMEK